MNELKGCPKCNYTGFHLVDNDDTRVVQCICSYAKTLKAYLGTEIASAATITQSQFFTLAGKGQPPKVDLTESNLFIRGYWSDLLPHLKWTLACKGPMFRYRIVTDEKLKSVYVGNESYKHRAKDVRDEVETFNSIGDLLGPEIDLIILRLGFLGYKNVAMPGVLKEALMLRESATKPTWLVDSMENPYVAGYHAYSEDTWDYICRLYQMVNLPTTRKPVALVEEDDEDVGMKAPPPPPQPRPLPVEIDLGAVSDEGKKFKKNGKKNKGGGPA